MACRLSALALLLLAVASLIAPMTTPAASAAPELHRYIIVVDGPIIQESLAPRMEALGARELMQLSVIPGYIALLSEDAASYLDSLPGVRVYRDWIVGLVEPVDVDRLRLAALEGQTAPRLEPAASNPSIGADLAHERGITGSGVTVAVLDTGIEDGHPYLQRNGSSVVVAEYDATGMGVVDYCGSRDVYYVFFGGGFHGTHVAGIIAGQTPVTGVAPGADIYDVIVAYEGPGYNCVITASAIIAGLDYAVKGPDGVEGTGDEADIINLSIGANTPPWIYASLQANPALDPLIQALENAARKALVVVAAGNEGPGPYTGNVFCSAPGVICVGAVNDNGTPWNDDDVIADFSSRGPEPWGRIEPAMVAPGVDVNSTLPTSTGIYVYPLSGTSMAAPHVAGALALMIDGLPLINDPRVYASLLAETGYRHLENSISGRPATVFDMGGGLIRVDNAFKARLVIEEPQVYIYTGGQTTIYYNVTIRPLYPVNATLNITLEGLTEYNTLQEPPQGSITVEPTQAQVTLGAPLNVTIRVNASQLDPGVYTGYLLVDDGVQPVTAAVSIVVPARPTETNATLILEGRLALGMSYGLEWNVLLVESPGYSSTFDLTVTAQATPAMVLALAPDGSLVYPAQRLDLGTPGTYAIILQPFDAYGIPEVAVVKAVAPLDNLTLDQVARYLNSLDDRLSTLEAEVAGLRQALAALNEAVDYTVAVLALLNQTLTGDIVPRLEAVEANVSDLRGQIARMEESLQSLANNTLQFADRLSKAEQDIAKLQDEAARLAGEIALLNQTLTDQALQLNQTTTSIELIQDRLETLSLQVQAVNATLATAMAGIEQVNQTLTILAYEATTAIQNLTQALAEAAQRIQELQAAQQEIAEDMADFNMTLNETIQTITMVNMTLHGLEARLEEAVAGITVLEEAVKRIEEVYKVTVMQLESLTLQIDEIKEEVAVLQEESTLLSERLDTVQNGTKRMDQKIIDLEGQVETLQARLDTVTRLLYILASATTAMMAALAALWLRKARP